jgi:hypothetical protein
MATIVTRANKNAPLTSAEVDANFNNLNADISTRLLTSTYTPSDVMQKVQQVDGQGSGLDADKVWNWLPNIAHTPGAATIVSRDINGNFGGTVITATTGFQGPILDSAAAAILTNTSGSAALSIANGTFSGTLSIGGTNAGNAKVQVAQGSSNIGLEIWAASAGTSANIASQRFMNASGTTERLGLYGTSDTVGEIKVPNTLNIWTGGVARLTLDSSGNQFNNGYISVQGIGAGQIMAVNGSATTWYNTMLRNDGNACYLLSSAVATTQALAINATFNNFRPFYWNLGTGGVGIATGGNPSETVTIGNAASTVTILAPTTVNNTLAVSAGNVLKTPIIQDSSGNNAIDIVKLGGNAARYTRNIYTWVDTIARTFTATWAVGAVFTDVTGFKAGSLIKLTLNIPARNDTGSWGGGYVEPQVRFNSGAWQSLGSSGHDMAVMTTATADCATYTNTILVDPGAAGITADFSFGLQLWHRSFDGTLGINNGINHDINVVSNAAAVPVMAGNNGFQFFTHVIVEELAIFRGAA